MQKKRPDAWKSVGALFCVPYMTIQAQNVGFQKKHLAL